MTGAEALFGAALALSWLNSAGHVLLSDRPLYAASSRSFFAPVRPARAAILALAGVATAIAIAAWTVPGYRIAGATSALLLLVAVRQWEKRQWHGREVVRLGKYVPAAACLLGWLVAAALTDATGGWEGAAGVLAACYVLAGASKLRLSGLRWAMAGNQALLIAERSVSGPRVLRAVRRRVASSPRACAWVGGVGLAAELACALYVLPPARPPLTVAVLAMHAGIALLLGYVEPEWWLVMMAITMATT